MILLQFTWQASLFVWLLGPRAHSFVPLWSPRSVVVTRWTKSSAFLSPRDDYYYPYEEDDPYANQDQRLYKERPAGGSKVERELSSMPLESGEGDYYYDDEEEEEVEVEDYAPLARPKNGRKSREDIDYYYDEESLDTKDEPEPLGNFWSNPQSSLDPAPLAVPRQRPAQARLPRQKRKTTTFRSGIPQPPPPVIDLYNRLFWYGFDPADNQESPADKTMFGGTKGKFNGLAYMYDGGPIMPKDARRRKPRSNRARDEDEEMEYSPPPDDDEEEYGSVTPPFDKPPLRASKSTPVPPRPSARRRQKRRLQQYPEEEEEEYHEPRRSQVSSWFDVDAQVDDDVNDDDDTNPRRRQRRSESRNDEKPLNPLEIFFGLNRENLSRQAQEYNRQMGLDNDVPRRQRSRQRPKRAGFAYRYNDDDDTDNDDYDPPVAELETILEEDVVAVDDVKRRNVPTPMKPSSTTAPNKRQLTWEERSMARERVPPADVPAWGPNGDLGIDARSHAISEATQDILQAQRRVKTREEKADKSREELSILKVDAELERQSLSRQRGDPRRIQQLLRDLDLKIEDAARALRYAELQLNTAREELAAVEARHWAVLSCYIPSQVENGIDEALRELEESEPAARRFREKRIEEERKREEEKKQAERMAADPDEPKNM